jgi:hypothetical protein
MAGTSTPIFPQTIKNFVAQILPADTTTKKTLVTGSANGTKVEMINITSTDTAARDVQFFLSDETTDYLLLTIAIPANSGNTNALVAQGFLSSSTTTIPYLPWFSFPLDNNGNRYIYVSSGFSLKVAAVTAVTAAKVINFVAQAGDF